MNLPAHRKILHVDMDAFYASIEQRDDPSLRGKPVVVGGHNRGVVAAASYEARKFGIHSAMPMREALRRCPALIRIAPRMGHYKVVSDRISTIFRWFTPLVEGLSLDEAFLDVTDSRTLFGSEVAIARDIKKRIFDDTRLTASVGVAPNKLVAKIASDLDKPDGLVVVTEEAIASVLDPLPVRVLPGIGGKTLIKLHQRGIRSVADLRSAPDRDLEPVFGRFAQKMREKACGIDFRPVVVSRPDKSLSAEETFDEDLNDAAALNRRLLQLAERTGARLRSRELLAGTVQLKVRRSDFATFTRQRALRPPGNGTGRIYEVAKALLRHWLGDNPGASVRLLGVGATELVPGIEQDLFSRDDVHSSPLDETIDEIRDRFGQASLNRARNLDPG